jgi:uncharacterized protein YggE
MQKRILTTVEAKGRAIAKFELAEFSVEVTERAMTASETRAAIVAAGARILKCVDGLRTRGMLVEPGSLQVPASTLSRRRIYRDSGEEETRGYEATYKLRWKTPTLEMVNDIYNQLLSIDAKDLDVATPHFSMRDPDALKTSALEAAWEKVKERFAHESSFFVAPQLGQDGAPSVLSWQVGYLTGYGETTPTELLEIHPGHAVVTVALQVTFGYPESP